MLSCKHWTYLASESSGEFGKWGLGSLADLKAVNCHSAPVVKNCWSMWLKIRLLVCFPIRTLKLFGVQWEFTLTVGIIILKYHPVKLICYAVRWVLENNWAFLWLQVCALPTAVIATNVGNAWHRELVCVGGESWHWYHPQVPFSGSFVTSCALLCRKGVCTKVNPFMILWQ